MILIGVSAVVLVLAFVVSVSLYRPMTELMQNIGLTLMPNQNEHEEILNYFKKTDALRIAAEQESEKYYEIAKNDILRRILQGYFQNLEQIHESELKQLRIPLSETLWYQLIKIGVQAGMQEAQRLRASIVSLIKEENLPLETVSVGNELYVILAGEKECSTGRVQLEDFVEKRLRSQIGQMLSVRNGSCDRGIIGISKSYFSLQPRMDDSRLYYPTEWEIQLITQLKYGNKDVVLRILTELEIENHIEGLDRELQIKITTVIFETFLRVMAELNIQNRDWALEYHDNLWAKNTDKQWKLLYVMADGISSEVAKQHQHKTSSVSLTQIKAYIDQNYTDSDISLKRLSAEFELSESTISKLFKEHGGELFTEYLCRLRMEKAKEYLQMQKYRIKEIAGMVGYQNELSFSNAFQKYEGIRPSQFMQFCREEQKSEK